MIHIHDDIIFHCTNKKNYIPPCVYLHDSDVVWDSTMAKNKIAEVTLLESIVPHDRKESALRLFAENNYSIKGTS